MPTRLTYAATPDLDPAWLPGGLALAYTYQRPESREGDRCIGFISPSGGSIGQEVCDRGLREADSVTLFELPAVSPTGDLAYLRTSRPSRTGQAGHSEIVVATADAPLVSVPARSVPFAGPDGALYVEIRRPAWVGAGQLFFVGIAQAVISPCPGCDPIVRPYPRALLRLAVGDPTVSLVPGGAFATSVSAGESEDIIYYTVANDTRIYKRVLSTGSVRTVHDFGAAGIARDVHYSNGRLAAIVGGSVNVINVGFGPLQLSGPGRLFLIDGGLGDAVELGAQPDQMYTSPALSPSGEGLAAVRFAIAQDATPAGLVVITTLTAGDIVRFGAD